MIRCQVQTGESPRASNFFWRFFIWLFEKREHAISFSKKSLKISTIRQMHSLILSNLIKSGLNSYFSLSIDVKVKKMTSNKKAHKNLHQRLVFNLLLVYLTRESSNLHKSFVRLPI